MKIKNPLFKWGSLLYSIHTHNNRRSHLTIHHRHKPLGRNYLHQGKYLISFFNVFKFNTNVVKKFNYF